MDALTNTMISCPQCQHLLDTADTLFNHRQCVYCNTIISTDTAGQVKAWYRHDIPSFSELIQTGTKLNWKGIAYTVTGRFRLWFAESVFNYWTIQEGNGTFLLLTEGYGLYAVYEPLTVKSPSLASRLGNLTQEKTIQIDLLRYELIRKNTVRFWDGEGCFYKPQSAVWSTYELLSADQTSVEMFVLEDESIQAYTAHSCSFTELNFSNLRRKFDTGKTFHCDHCSCDTTLPLFPYVQSWTCRQCNRAYAYFNGGVREDAAISRQKTELRFDINSIISLKGVDYLLIGHMLKKEVQEGFLWNEYVLYNKEEGFAFLNESDGHWLLVKELGHPLPESCASAREFEYDGRSFRLFNNYGFSITHAQGSFPGNVFNDAYQLYTREFISPPYLISIEQGNAEYSTWFIGSSVSRKELENQAKGYLPTPMGVGPAELKSSSDKTIIIRTTFAAVLLLFLVHIFAGSTMRERVLLYNTYTMGDSVANQSFVTEPFELAKWRSNLELVIDAPVDNSWFELEATLVNKVSGDEYSLQQGVEHYHGYEDGERWAEGSTTETAYMNSIPAGTYFFRFNGVRDPYSFNFTSSRLNQFSVKVTNDVPSHRNLILLLLLVLVWPVYKVVMINYYERSRWEHSPYNPYPVNY